MATLPFRAATTAGNGASTDRLIGVPAGVVNGDHLWLQLYIESGAAAPLVFGGLPGWTVDARGVNIGTTPDFESVVFRKIASAEPASYTITWDGVSYWNTASMEAWSGGDGSTQQDATPTYNEDEAGSATLTGTSVTTATNDAEVILSGYHFLDTTTATPPAGMTERVEFGTNYVAAGPQATAGASGNKSATLSASDQWGAILSASKPAPAGGLSIPVATATYRRRRV